MRMVSRSVPFLLLGSGFSFAGCGLFIGLGNFTDEPTGAGGSSSSSGGGSSVSSTMSASSSSSTVTGGGTSSTGGAGGGGGNGGAGGMTFCKPDSTAGCYDGDP